MTVAAYSKLGELTHHHGTDALGDFGDGLDAF
jgi:hypothetical protein